MFSDLPEGFQVEAAPTYADIPEGFEVESGGGETVRAKTPAIRPPMYGQDGVTPLTPGEVGDIYNRNPPQVQPFDIMGTLGKVSSDPLGALGGSAETIATKLGMEPAWAARLGRDMRDLPAAMGPLGMEFAPASGVPRQPKPIAQTQAMPRAAVRTEEELLKTGGSRMGAAKQSEATVSAEDMQSSLAEFNKRLRGASLRVHPKLHSTAAPVYDDLLKASAAPQTLEELHYLRQMADDVAAKPGTEGKIGGMLKSTIDDIISKHPEGAKFAQGKTEYARAKKSQIITEAMEKARNSVLWDRGKESAALRHQIKSLLDNKQYKHIWSAEERAALKSAKARTLMEVFGGFGSKNISGAAFGRILEVGLTLPPGTLWVPGYFARNAANARSLQKLEDIGAKVRAGGEVQAKRVDQLKDLVSPKVLTHILGQAEGAKRVATWLSSPSAQTARALGAYMAQKLNVPNMAERIASELQGTEQSYADE
jgi:hypothetical protein